jgi:hypothetical protein
MKTKQIVELESLIKKDLQAELWEQYRVVVPSSELELDKNCRAEYCSV